MYDVLIIGAGPAGLSSALALARVRCTSAVFDSGRYRNARARYSHNYLSRDHVPPSELLNVSKAQLKEPKYQKLIHFAPLPAVDASKVEKGFEVKDKDGKVWQGKKLILAVGCTDIMSDIPGYSDLWGSHLFPCPYCDGLEESGGHVGVLADTNSPHFASQAMQSSLLAEQITLFTNGGDLPDEKFQAQVDKRGFKVDKRKIKTINKDPSVEHGVLLKFEEGQDVQLNFMMHKPKHQLNGDFHEQLGLEVTPAGVIKTNPTVGPTMQQTSLPGCFAAGDCQSMVSSVASAVQSGQYAGVAAVGSLLADS